MTSTAEIYGDSLYALAEEENIADALLSEINDVDAIIKANPDYLRILREPSIAKTDRLKLIDEAFSGKIHTYLLNFIKILCENGTINELPSCVRQFTKRYNEANGISEAYVTSAVELSDDQKESLRRKLEDISGRKIILIEKVDINTVAGLKVELDGKQFDGTVSRRIKTIRKQVSDIIV